jgi:hypothetical protein
VLTAPDEEELEDGAGVEENDPERDPFDQSVE